MSLQHLSIRELADKLNKTRKRNSKYEDEVPECKCVLGAGCRCGRFQYDRKWSERKQRLDWDNRAWPLLPKKGRKYLISRPPDTEANYAQIDFWYWAQLEGAILPAKKVDQDESSPDVFWVLFDIRKYSKVKHEDWCWIPNDALIEVEQ